MNYGMDVPLITVAICSFNGERYLEKTLISVLAQDYSNFEIVIIDDGSTDGTISIIERFADQNKCIRPFFRTNHGLPASRNFAFAQAKGAWIAIVDQDDLYYPARLSRQARVAQKYPTAGVVFCDVHHINESDEVTGNYLSTFTLPESFIRKGDAGNLLLKLGCFSASASILIRRETVQSVGAFDESLAYSCDYDYFVRAGFEFDFAYTSDILAAWRSHAKQATKTYRRVGHESRSVYWRYCRSANALVWTKAVLLGRILKSLASDIAHTVGA